MGTTLLRALAALHHADEINASISFIEIPLVISSFLEWSSDLEDYGVDEEYLSWRAHPPAYFKKGKFGTDKTALGAAELVEEAESSTEDELPKKSDKDPWKWAEKLKEYKSQHGTPGIRGTKYNITKMSRAERMKHAFDGEDP
jgi:hypothetical protein